MTRARIMRAREDGDEWPADQVERWPLTKLIPYARNARARRLVASFCGAAVREEGRPMCPLASSGDAAPRGLSLDSSSDSRMFKTVVEITSATARFR